MSQARLRFENHLSQGFTIIELLVVVTIITILISILLPTLRQARSVAKRAVCLSNLHQNGIAYWMYATDFKDSMPLPGGYQGYSAGEMILYTGNGTPAYAGGANGVGAGLLHTYLSDMRSMYCPDYFSTYGGTVDAKDYAAKFDQVLKDKPAWQGAGSTYMTPWYNGFGPTDGKYYALHVWYMTFAPLAVS